MDAKVSRSLVRSAGLLALLLLSTGTASAREAQDPQSGVPDSIRHFETLTLGQPGAPSAPGSAALRALPSGGRLAVSLRTLGRNFDLDLEPNDLFTPGAKTVWIDEAGEVVEEPKPVFFRGRVKGSDDSWVRLAVRRGVLDGMIWTPEEVYFVEPASRFFDDSAPGEMVAYRLSDTESDWTDESCATEEPPNRQRAHRPHAKRDGRSLYQALAAALQEMAPATGLKELDLGLVADYEYYLRHFGDSANFMQSLMNLMDGVYQREINLKVRISHTIVFATSNDPFSSTTDPSTALSEIGNYKGSNSSPGGSLYGADLAHLFTGRNLDGSVVGIAWVGTTCNTTTGAGLSQDYTSTINSLVSLTAHEVGHNLNAQHDTTAGCPSGYIMNPSVVTVSDLNNLHFSSCSQSTIANHIANRSCLADVEEGTPTPTPTATPIPPTATSTSTPVPTNGATFVSQSVPTSMVAGQQYQVWVRFRNSGGTTWGANHRLGAQNPWDNRNWGMNRVTLGSSVSPGQEYIFSWTVTAPATAGNYNFQWRMLEESVEWFGPTSQNVVVNVQAPAAGNAATFVSQSVPTSMVGGQQYQVSVRMRNTGTTTWGANHRLGSQNPYDNWNFGMHRVDLGATVAPGVERTVTWTVTAPPITGNYNFQWRMLEEFVERFGQPSTNVVVNVQAAPGTNGSKFVSENVPSVMQVGQQYEVSVTFRNTGTKTWTGNHRLGSQNPYDNWNWNMNRVAFASSVAPGAEYTATWTVRAPSSPGQYPFQWRVLEEYVEWFGDVSPNFLVTVQ